jgi:hypothetical protein
MASPRQGGRDHVLSAHFHRRLRNRLVGDVQADGRTQVQRFAQGGDGQGDAALGLGLPNPRSPQIQRYHLHRRRRPLRPFFLLHRRLDALAQIGQILYQIVEHLPLRASIKNGEIGAGADVAVLHFHASQIGLGSLDAEAGLLAPDRQVLWSRAARVFKSSSAASRFCAAASWARETASEG